MKRGLDTNVLVYAHIASLPEHGAVHSFLVRQLARKDVTLVVTPGILHEFVHVVTDSRRFSPPVPMGEALGIARLYLERANVECLSVGPEALLHAFALVERLSLGRKRLADALLSAALLDNGVRHLITCNGADFDLVPGLQVIDPRDAKAH